MAASDSSSTRLQGIREQAEQTQQDRARVAQLKAGEALAEARDKKKLDAFLKDALRKGLIPKKKKKLPSG